MTTEKAEDDYADAHELLTEASSENRGILLITHKDLGDDQPDEVKTWVHNMDLDSVRSVMVNTVRLVVQKILEDCTKGVDTPHGRMICPTCNRMAIQMLTAARIMCGEVAAVPVLLGADGEPAHESEVAEFIRRNQPTKH